jgi:phosphopantetheine adenylyltransferase/dephospho-CoA kinase|tara:strand:- start:1620 stop:2207 length:588 start_codon:yes stop_codon:yes gene_type:complete
MKIICLTGGMASGKSTAARYLGEQGADVIDADKLGHRAYEPDTQAYREVIATFGDDLLADDKSIDRKALGGKVFGKPEELKKLTDIVWPEIRRLAEAEIKASDPDNIVVLEAAVLFEAGWEDIGDEVWVVVVDRELAITRAIARDGFDRESVESRLDSQINNEERTSKSDVVISNNDSEEGLLEQLDQQWHRLMS